MDSKKRTLAMTTEPKVGPYPVVQIGIVVANVDRAIEYYRSNFGWGPFLVREAELKGCTYHGRPSTGRLKLAFAQAGSVQIELIQPLEGDGIHSEFLRERGEGLQHIGVAVDGLEETMTDLSKRGIDPVFHRISPESAFAYLSSDQSSGVTVELLERHRFSEHRDRIEKWMAEQSQQDRVVEATDGNDPAILGREDRS